MYVGAIVHWITPFYACTLSCNLLSTLLVAYRIWDIDRRGQRAVQGAASWKHTTPVVKIILESAAIYSVALIIVFGFYNSKSNLDQLLVALFPPIISIASYIVVIRVSSRARSGLSDKGLSSMNISSHRVPSHYPNPASPRTQLTFQDAIEDMDSGLESESKYPTVIAV